MCDEHECSGCSGCPEFIEVTDENLSELAEAMTKIEFEQPLEGIELTKELCLEFLIPLKGETVAMQVFQEMFDQFLLQKQVERALWEMAQSGEVGMSVDENGEPVFFEEEEDDEEDSQKS